MIRLGISLLVLLFSSLANAQGQYYFFTEDDINNIKSNSKTEWGRDIIEDLKTKVEERKKHNLNVPLLEGGHLHDYFCPKHNTMFTFDWSSPTRHFCHPCDKYWEDNKRYDWAWINVLHAENLNYIVASMYLYISTQDVAYANNISNMLLDYASKYNTYFEHNTNRKSTTLNSGRMYGQSLDEAVWASDAARAYVAVKSAMNQEDVKKIEEGYLEVAAQMLLNRKGGGNWQVWHNSGLIALGVALQNDSIIDIALDDPKHGYHYLMDTYVYADGWWNEGSPTYHYYPLRALLLSADAVRFRGINLYANKLYNMLASPAMGVYSDLSFPAHNDGWYGESLLGQVSLYEVASQRYNDHTLKSVLQESYTHIDRKSPEALINGLNIDSSSAQFVQNGVQYPDLGVSILRSNHKTLVFKYGPHGGGHGHPDKLSISIHNGKKEILPDMGTSAYGVPDFTEWYRKTLSHSTITVDGKDQKESQGHLISFNPTSQGGKVEASAPLAYEGVFMTRSLSLSGDSLIDIFSIASSEKHTYDYTLIFADKPIFEQVAENYSLENSGAYQRITNTKIIRASGSIKWFTANANLEMRVTGADHFELIMGEAPGIPPRNPTIAEPHLLAACYPLLVRIRGENVEIETKWLIK